jgi:arylsulfatase A-like enzyme
VPFYLQVNFPGPHPPWDAPDTFGAYHPYGEHVVLPNLVRPGEPWSELVALAQEEERQPRTERRIREISAKYWQRVTHVDRALGLVLDALQEAGRLDDTWIVCTSDHGEMLGEKFLMGKVVMFRPVSNVPLFVRPPGGVARWTSDAYVELVDVARTMLTLAGLDPAQGERGEPLVDLVTRGPDDPGANTLRDDAVAECMGFGSLRTPEHLLVVDEAAGAPVEYYDLVEDPNELDNRVDDPATAAIRSDLLARLLDRIA